MRTFRKSFLSLLIASLRFYYLKLRFPSSFHPKGIGLIGKNTRVYLSGGQLYLQQKVFFSQDSFIDIKGEVRIGTHCTFNDSLRLVAHKSIVIGDYVIVAAHVSIFDHDHAYTLRDSELIFDEYVQGAVQIGNHVWIGEKATILKGVTIGDNVIIGAGSVVTQNIPANCIAAGNPAKIIRAIE
jgi:acetyltransferase-like isoleucine patch superfamily enzyme